MSYKQKKIQKIIENRKEQKNRENLNKQIKKEQDMKNATENKDTCKTQSIQVATENENTCEKQNNKRASKLSQFKKLNEYKINDDLFDTYKFDDVCHNTTKETNSGKNNDFM